MAHVIELNESLNRFELTEEGHLALVEFEREGNVLTLTHTEVPEALGGRGIAGELVKYALETARSQGWKVRPTCSYAAAYIKRHPEHQDLLA